MSARLSVVGSAAACSGAMYAGVPIAMPSDVSDAPAASVEAESAFATPKSVTTAEPPERSTLSGLMSRCTMPRACAYASAFATSRRMLTVSCTVSSCSRASRARSDSPSTYGIVKYGIPSETPVVSTGTMCGCCSAALTVISRRKRSTLTAADSSGGSSLITTRRSSAASRATNTRDIPPPPSSRSMT